MKKQRVIVTGASGYIGGATCIELNKSGIYEVIGVDRKRMPHLMKYMDTFCLGDFNTIIDDNFIECYEPVAIIHCAALSSKEDGNNNPEMYYEENVVKTFKLLQKIKNKKIKFIFASSANVLAYQQNKYIYDINPASTYGRTKLFCEKIIRDFHSAYDINYTILRYFNVCGSIDKKHGQQPYQTNIFSELFKSALENKPFTLNFDKYPTEDGTCIRDYVHVLDIAKLNMLSVSNSTNGTFDVGSGVGTSIKKSIELTEKFLNKNIDVLIKDKGEGESGFLVSDITETKRTFNWSPVNSNFNDILSSLSKWYNSKVFNKYKHMQEVVEKNV